MKIILILISTFSFCSVYAQSIFDTFGNQASVSRSGDLATETIDRISISRRIFIITNQANSFGKGDFITLLVNDEPIARAVAAKTTDNQLAGIKILTIYTLDLWNQLKVGQQVQIFRGDDSGLRAQRTQAQENPDTLIASEEDLFNDTTFLEDDLQLDENQNRVIKNDHLFGFQFAKVEGVNNDFAVIRYDMYNASYAYQIDDNIFLEGMVGRNVVNDFPFLGLDTTLTNLVARAKYTFEGPYLSFFQPYVGYQTIMAASAEAGEPGEDTPDEQLQNELKLLDEMKKNRIVFGVTVMRRLVPGWFFRADLGSDLLSAGLTIEF
jgi:hypothetical protein